MFSHWQTSGSRKGLRSIIAATLMLFFLAEWGTHAVIHIGAHAPARAVVISTPETGDDPCHSFIHCDHNGHRDRQVPSTGHDIIPNVIVDNLADLVLPGRVDAPQPGTFTGVPGLSRPPDPAFHPPELS